MVGTQTEHVPHAPPSQTLQTTQYIDNDSKDPLEVNSTNNKHKLASKSIFNQGKTA